MKLIIGSVLAIAALPLVAAEPQPAVMQTQISVLIQPHQVRERCGAADRVQACTHFIGQRLVCNCRPSAAGWQLDAQVRFISIVYTTGGPPMMHENGHIRDVLNSAESYIRELSSRTFDSWIACETAASVEAARFNNVMDGFKISSNRRRHPAYVQRPPNPVESLHAPEPPIVAASPGP